MKIDVELLAKTIVKPSSQTPDHLRRHQLSSIDQVIYPIFMPLILFYPQNNKLTNKERCERLKKSLADALTVFYPLAGRLKDNDYVDCNDEGVHFVEVEAKCTIQDILQDPDCSDNYKLLPFRIDSVNDLVAFVQVTYFQCGGMAIGIGMSHKIGDVVSMVMFVNGWAAISCGKGNIGLPVFDCATHFPPINASGFDSRMEKEDHDSDIVLKRFVFDAPTIEALKDRYVDKKRDDPKHATLRRPSRIEALTAFLSIKFIDAIKTSEGDGKTLYYIYHPLNLRSRMNPPLSHQHFGNFIVLPAVATINIDDADQDRCYNIISQMRNTTNDMNSDHVKRDDILRMMKERAERVERERNENILLLHFTSLCRFPVYEADFGWGRPLWVSSARWPVYNFASFFDTKEGGGIEVWIQLKEEAMAKFEADNELISLVSPVGRYLN